MDDMQKTAHILSASSDRAYVHMHLWNHHTQNCWPSPLFPKAVSKPLREDSRQQRRAWSGAGSREVGRRLCVAREPGMRALSWVSGSRAPTQARPAGGASRHRSVVSSTDQWPRLILTCFSLASVQGLKDNLLVPGTGSLTGSRQLPRPRATRVCLRDLVFCMEQERDMKHSRALYLALLK